MERTHKELLRVNLVYMVENLVLDEVFISVLQSEGIITTIMVEELESYRQPTKKNSFFLSSLLPRRGPRAFEVFIKTLMMTGQDWIAEKLDPSLAKKHQGLMPQASKISKPLNPAVKPIESKTQQPSSKPSSFFNPQPNDRLITLGGHDMTFIPVNIDDVDANTASSLLSDSKNVYKMTSDPRGKCIIINNTTFTNMSLRDGSNFDAVNLSELFRKLNFAIDIWSEKSAKEIITKIDTERQIPNLVEYDCLVIAILSHGNRGLIYGVDTEKVSIEEEIVKPFDSFNCPAMAGKPKVFLIQACQGDDVTQGMAPQADGPTEHADASPTEEENKLVKNIENMKLTDDADSVPIIPNTHEKADMVMAYSTVPGYKSWRRPDLGSWFMRDIVSIFSAQAHKEHLIDMLTQVGRQISERHVATKGFVQINETRTTLRKKLYFLPGYSTNTCS